MHAALFGKTDCVEAILQHHANRREYESTKKVSLKLKERADKGSNNMHGFNSDGVEIKPADVLVLAPGQKNEEKVTVAKIDQGLAIKLKSLLRFPQYAPAC